MRACKESEDLLRIMGLDKNNDPKMKDDKWEDYRINDKKKIMDLLKSDDYYLGVRENYVNIYYKGMSIAKIETYWNRACKYTTSYYYATDIDGYKKDEGQVTLPPTVFWNDDNLKKQQIQVEKHVFGKHDKHYRFEKVCQQWIINANNSNPDSEWYYIDMEYVYKAKGTSKKPSFGRADLIAIKRMPNENEKHKVALVELKVGKGAYSGKRDSDEKMQALKSKFYDKKVDGIKLGSGLASHMVDFMHFFYGSYFVDQVKEEIVGMINWHKEFGLIDKTSKLAKVTKPGKIEDKPDIYIVTYSALPEKALTNISIITEIENPAIKLKDLKQAFYDYMYGKSKMAFVKIVKEKFIQGIAAKKEEFKTFIKNGQQQIECFQDINGDDYKFVFRFIDVDDKKINCEKCI